MATEQVKYNPFIEWLITIADHVPDDLVRYYVYWRIFYFLGGVGHLFALLLFLATDVTFMVFFNIFSVLVFLAAFLLLERGYYRAPFWAINTELILHGIAATICVGPLYSFQNFSFLVVVLAFIQPFYISRVSSLLAGSAVPWRCSMRPTIRRSIKCRRP